MMKAHRILFLVYDGFELLDASGPAAVFSAANLLCGEVLYETELISPEGGHVVSGSGISVLTTPLNQVSVSGSCTLLVMGAVGSSLRLAMADKVITGWLVKASLASIRYGSVCTGAFILAEAGLLDGKRAATHWEGCKRLAQYYPSVKVEPDALYIVDEKVWTSAGATTGIDMALAMLEKDFKAPLAGQVAKRLVVYMHRPGNQSQFSSVLDAQITAGDRFSELIGWIHGQLDQPIRVEDMARQVSMSERTFYRKFTSHFGITPSKFLERARMEKARMLLEAKMPVKVVASAVGFRSEAGFRSAFCSQFAISPSIHALMHAKE